MRIRQAGLFLAVVHEWTYDRCIDGSTTDSTRKNLVITRIPEINGKKDATTELKNVPETTYKQVK